MKRKYDINSTITTGKISTSRKEGVFLFKCTLKLMKKIRNSVLAREDAFF